VSSRWSDLDRPPLDGRGLARDLAGTMWRDLRVVEESESTNADVAAAARAGAPEGLVVVAERQTAGRGRLGRTWTSPPRAGLTFSVLLRPQVPPPRRSLVPLLAGLAVAEAVTAIGRLDVRLKWPNDLLDAAGGRKLAGILAEAVALPDGDAVVVGTGLNVTTRADELPDERAGSLLLAGAAVTDRTSLLKELLRAFDRRYIAWARAAGSAESVLPAYREVCETIGRRVRLELPAGAHVVGTATSVDDDGRLRLRTDDGAEQSWAAGDVVHLRPEG
jgi:BirA family biotin operon repressor/biotin-[acetyl-CoA-carboxylase] ligase